MTWWVIDMKHEQKKYPFESKEAAISFYNQFMINKEKTNCWGILIQRPSDFFRSEK